TWQTKLSNLHVASFPWEPTPAPPPPQPMAATVPSNGPKPINAQSSSNAQTPSAAAPAPAGAGNVRIKSEPDTDHSPLPAFSGYQPNLNYDNKEAQQRAAAALKQKFGTDADLQVSQLTGQAHSPYPGGRPSPNPGNIQLPPQLSEQQRREYAAQQRQRQSQQMQQAQQAQQRPIVGNAQTDGAGEWSEMVAQRRAAALENPNAMHEADLTLRDRLEQMSHDMEGGGLMMPLSERANQPQAKKRKVAIAELTPSSYKAHAALQTSNTPRKTKVPQLDGLGESDDEGKAGIKDEDDLEDDEDAINSDLDDPDDNIVEQDPEEGPQGQIMVCTYDKVARVKNKWKCTLKDGVLTTGGKEYTLPSTSKEP
ncbi:MAG: hypothetical protein Q9191_008383, partial [Dirinaria sp. TL-2023a]